jgi:hypothetical protein
LNATMLVGGCFHIPYHDVKAWGEWVRLIKERRPTYIAIVGDFTECAGLSRHEDADDCLHLEHIQENEMLFEMRAASPNSQLLRVLGNHDFVTRYDRAKKSLQGSLLADYNNTVKENEHWKIKRYINGPDGILWCGPIALWHGHRHGGNGGKIEALRWLFDNTLGVRAHSHVPDYVPRIPVYSNVKLNRGYLNVGTFTDTSPKAKKGRWLERMDTSEWAPVPAHITFNDKRKLFVERQYEVERIPL